MRKTIASAGGLVLLSLCIAVVAGCATSSPGSAPIVERNASRGASQAAAPDATATAPLEPGFHLVQRGDTLYSIARQYGQDPKNIIVWNQIENPNAITPGQRVRVAPPPAAGSTGTNGAGGAVAEVKPIVEPGGVETRPLDSGIGTVAGPTPSGPGVAEIPAAPFTDSVKREPRGGKQPYSEQAWANARSGNDKPAGSDVAPPAGTAAAPPAGANETKPKPRPAEGALGWSWPTNGKIVVGFNDPSSKGIDINGKLGDPVLAAAPGKVLYAGQDLRGYGKLVVVKHSNQYLSVYAHNSEILVKEGEAVKTGQKIAELGRSDAKEPKLHFEIRRQGKPVDPLQYLPAR